MKKALLTILLFSLITCCSKAQSKVFKEVSEDISTQMSAIVQDGTLMGYLVFTQLEKASADSFNYKIVIMDENLNDIGTIDFREQKLWLKAVSFEGDVLCLAYLKSNFAGIDFKNKKAYRDGQANARSFIFTQFLGLDGKIIKSNTIKINMAAKDAEYLGGWVGGGSLKHDIQLRNIHGKGFACFYGDDNKNWLLVFNTDGKLSWQKNVREEARDFGMLTSGTDVYILEKNKDPMQEGGFEMVGYNTADSTVFPKYVLKDKRGNSLKVLAFDNDPASGRPYVSGYVISPTQGNDYLNANQLARGTYTGVFTVDFTGHKKGDIHETFSYWTDGSQSIISAKGRLADKTYPRFERSFKDYAGNTYFTGSAFSHQVKWVSVAFYTLTAPLIIPSLGIMGLCGSQKARLKDAVLVRQNAKGVLSLENSIALKSTNFYRGMVPIGLYDQRSFYGVTDGETRTNYLIIDDAKNIFLYNVNQKKVSRTIPHVDGNIHTSVYPAKEGHVLVSEYNKKERYTRYSIESL